MQLLALERPVAGIADERFTPGLLAEEARKAWDLRQAGVFREMYFSADEHEAILMLECESVEAARAHLAGLPLVREGLIDFRIIPLVPYSGFARLFRDIIE